MNDNTRLIFFGVMMMTAQNAGLHAENYILGIIELVFYVLFSAGFFYVLITANNKDLGNR